MSKTYYVYIVTNRSRSTLYVGVTNNLERRMYEHKTGHFEGFSKRYRLTCLVYYEEHGCAMDAITREKQLKRWYRSWKDELIEMVNPTWLDLSAEWFGEDGRFPLSRE